MRNLKARFSTKSTFAIEIVANYPYPLRKSKAGVIHSGTFHAYLTLPGGWDMDLRGIYYKYCRKKFYIRYPSRKGDIDGKECQYLVYSFLNGDKQKELTRAIIKSLYEFVKSNEFAQSRCISQSDVNS